jgi:uncharacterized membrane protein
MNVNFQYSKSLAIEGAVLLLLGPVPAVGPILAIIGVILLLKATKELSNYYQDDSIHKNTWTGLKYYIVAILALAVGVGVGIASFAAAGAFAGVEFSLTAGFIGGIIAIFAGLAVAFAFYLLAAIHLRKVYDTLAQKTGEASFTTASTLLLIGAILTILGVGVLLIFISWIFIILGFSSMKPKDYQPYSYAYPNGNGYTAPPTTQQNTTTQP